jgi:hypothetical protein
MAVPASAGSATVRFSISPQLQAQRSCWYFYYGNLLRCGGNGSSLNEAWRIVLEIFMLRG